MSREPMRFPREEDGATSVEWVVLTASLVGLALAVTAGVGGGLERESGRIDATLSEDHTAPQFR